jgi:hypothetical protein
VIIVVDGNQVAELQVASHGRSLAGDTLHSTAITEEHICVVVDELKAGLVEYSGSVCLSDGQTDSVGETLAERAGGDFDAGGVVGLGVAGRDAVNLLEADQ